MGFNATVVVMVDALHIIEKDPEFGKTLAEAINQISHYREKAHGFVSSGGHVNAAEVIEVHHADGKHLIAVGGNTGWDLGRVTSYRSTEEEMLRAWADRLGFTLRRKAK